MDVHKSVNRLEEQSRVWEGGAREKKRVGVVKVWFVLV